MDIKELKRFIKWAKKQGVASMTTKDFTIAFNETAVPIKSNKKRKSIEGEEIPSTTDPMAAMPGDTDMLFWSTEAFDNIQDNKRKM